LPLLAKVRSRRMMWAKKRRKMINVGVLREDGGPFESDEHAARGMQEYW